jgi:hypothetical protein
MKKEVLEVMMAGLKAKRSLPTLIRQCDEFAEKLKNDFPGEIVEYYWKKSYKNIARRNRHTIARAINYLKKAEKIYVNILKDKKSWDRRIRDLKKEFNYCGPFLEGVKKL